MIPAQAESLYSFEKNFKEHRFQLDLNSQFEYTKANFDADSTYKGLEHNNSLKIMNLDLGARWVPLHKIGFFSRLWLNNVDSVTNGVTRSNSILGDMQFGFDTLIKFGEYEMIPSIELNIPMNRIDYYTDEALAHEGSQNVKTVLLFRKNYTGYLGYGKLGLDFRDEGRSHLLPWGLGVSWKLNSYDVGVELSGFQSITYDSKSETANVKTDLTDRVNGGSFKFFNVNPHQTDLRTWVNYRLDPDFIFGAGIGTTLFGRNTSSGWNFLARMTYEFDYGVQTVNRQKKNDPLSPERALKKFKEKTLDGVDQDLFAPKEVPPSNLTPTPTDSDLPSSQQIKKLIPKNKIQSEDDEIIRNVEDLNSELKKPQSKP